MNSEVTEVRVKIIKNCATCRKNYEWDSNMPKNKTCKNCQFWLQTAVWDIIKKDAVIINRQHYRINDTGMFNFGGKTFKIRYFDGTEIETQLGHQGEIPLTFAENPVFFDNAEFVKA